MNHITKLDIPCIDIDADPINENWLRIIRAERLGHWDDYERLSGYKLKRPTPEEMALKVFVDDDEGYLYWCEWAAGKNGYVLNTYRIPSPKYLMLHRVTCRHIRPADSNGQNWTHHYAKVCALNREELNLWAKTHTNATSHPCRTCKPNQDVDLETPSARVRIAELACEGGGESLYGRRQGEDWIYWTEGSSITIDENDTDYFQSWHGEETKDPFKALSSEWSILSPIYINPEYLEAFRLGYKQQVATLTAKNRYIHNKWVQARWEKYLYNR